MKIIAFYLPQFHSIPENDKWWGHGFTEWTNTKKALPLYDNHHQPKEPLDNNYYSLLDENTRDWQANIAKKYGIYGFCYYHYWFNGKKLLEKPLEEVLKLNKPDLPFCMCWANEPWTRSWDGKEREILMAQYYGDKNEWKNHFEYLLQFFNDKRYIKVRNMPMFVIYRTSSISTCDDMISYWDDLAKQNGFDGIYIVEEVNSFQIESQCIHSKAVLEFEPMLTMKLNYSILRKIKSKLNKIINKNKALYTLLDTHSYDKVWRKIVNRISKYDGKDILPGSFVDWDNTSRRGHQATIMTGANPEKFEYYMKRQIRKAVNKYGSEFIFINAWNEWAEGAYLEPDKEYGYRYLEAIKNSLDEVENKEV